MTFGAEQRQPVIRAQQKKTQQSLTSTDQVVSSRTLAKPVAMVSASLRDEELKAQRIRVGSNLSDVRRVLKSGTFKPLPPADKDEYEKIVDKSVKDDSFKPLETSRKVKGIIKRESVDKSGKIRSAHTFNKPEQEANMTDGFTANKIGKKFRVDDKGLEFFPSA